MECNTFGTDDQPLDALVPPDSMELSDQLARCLPAGYDLEATARATKALCRRRQVRSASDLLRLVLFYAVCDCSLRLVAVWCALRGLGALSKPAVRQRLRHSVPWLRHLVMAVLEARQLRFDRQPGVRVRLVDATVISEPGSKGTDWRLHLGLDLGEGSLIGAEVTNAHGAETLDRIRTSPGEIRVADRGYAYANGVGPVLAMGARVVVRTNWQNLRLEGETGARLDVTAWLKTAPADDVQVAQEREVWLTTPQGRFGLRLIACPLPPEKAEEARRRTRRAASKKKRNADQRTLLAAGFVLLLTNLPQVAWPAHRVLELYRIRWQVEILIKRLKSLLNLDGLRARDPELAEAYLLGKLLGALLVDTMSSEVRRRQPAWWTDERHPVNLWRLTALCAHTLAEAIRGPLTWAMVMAALPKLRYLCDEPRKRQPQWQTANKLLLSLSRC